MDFSKNGSSETDRKVEYQQEQSVPRLNLPQQTIHQP